MVNGWHLKQLDGSFSHSEVPVPEPFELTILEFVYIERAPIVAFGRITSDQHSQRGWWVAIVPLLDNSRGDIVNEATFCGTMICPEKPGFDDQFRSITNINVAVPKGLPALGGISAVCKSEELIRILLES